MRKLGSRNALSSSVVRVTVGSLLLRQLKKPLPSGDVIDVKLMRRFVMPSSSTEAAESLRLEPTSALAKGAN